ncbi:MAG: DNA modification methylase [Candidatus Taylorbacteria bacterium RIFCSPHIGHO2_02_FULL_45_28]|jgi:type II restriction enzyme|uniref:DNA modification methylase n=1 Tax=Candidatus Taylorbacteria bacterium RIFCSPHIGHO2_12_FULL_45_16 TaxID=1802315 RepID=A0A1G2MXT3_9BACT|nr:MAG: DNA modification methylase [Candidatus Taylorbacteria bacterium RIFCSPHIGHO2_01_FULL_44_110]OHA25309.1 MAG: DNA modification methylase [Candidatus Taylorbacteria bacterium RIFCSPHIGHO2_02_FULL_45_28]OHA28697.1 MAG: DNA modification methylase [Candidatus Taylorbacteria bacterium RIFCSPHIGHO2_12_FULL_45_16]OHA32970.1 MAG: DNA modification methylase [Candidatus Taylorbacteria bacterium RIFCSPLOWO2_01_FULL_45_59]OHA38458.1 MAG: DNA modification methylase [Candidatus Taylorbacteria bacterium
MTIKDLIKIYDTKKSQYGVEAYRHISNVLREAKEQHGKDFTGDDHEQSWRAFKGKNLEKLIEYIITDEVHALSLQVVNGNTLERTNGSNLSKELSELKRNLTVDYGEFGLHLPDVDLIIFDPKTSKVVAVLSSKVTLRERIAQTGYWKMKLASDKATKHIKVYFVTPDEDGTLTMKKPTKKGRAIVEVDTDGSYVLSETNIEESDKVKMFDKFIDDLKKLLK